MIINFDQLKTFYNALEQKMKSLRGDWNQNDPNADDYIENRPFYSEVKDAVALPKTTITVDGAGQEIYDPFRISLIKGVTYTVVFDGKTYECIAKETYENEVFIGNSGILGWNDNKDTGEPFFIDVYTEEDFSEVCFAANTSGTHAISVSVIQEVVHKLDKKFIDMPEGGGVTPDELAQVAFDGDYNSLSNTPAFANVAISGNYNDLSNVPEIKKANLSEVNVDSASYVQGVVRKESLPAGYPYVTYTLGKQVTYSTVFEFEVIRKSTGELDSAINLAHNVSISDLTPGNKYLLRAGDKTLLMTYKSPEECFVLENGDKFGYYNSLDPNHIEYKVRSLIPLFNLDVGRYIHGIYYAIPSYQTMSEAYLPDTVATTSDVAGLKTELKNNGNIGYMETTSITYDGNEDGKVIIEMDGSFKLIRVGDYIDLSTVTEINGIMGEEKISVTSKDMVLENTLGDSIQAIIADVGFESSIALVLAIKESVPPFDPPGTYVISTTEFGLPAYITEVVIGNPVSINPEFLPAGGVGYTELGTSKYLIKSTSFQFEYGKYIEIIEESDIPNEGALCELTIDNETFNGSFKDYQVFLNALYNQFGAHLIAAGNASLFDSRFPNSGERFAVLFLDTRQLRASGNIQRVFIYADDLEAPTTYHHITYHYTPNIIHKVDPKYLPKGGFGYSEGKNWILFESHNLTLDDQDAYNTSTVTADFSIGLEEGKIYKVTLDSGTYTTICRRGDGVLFLGNFIKNQDGSVEDHFLVAEIFSDDKTTVIDRDKGSNITVSEVETIHAINSKYIYKDIDLDAYSVVDEDKSGSLNDLILFIYVGIKANSTMTTHTEPCTIDEGFWKDVNTDRALRLKLSIDQIIPGTFINIPNPQIFNNTDGVVGVSFSCLIKEPTTDTAHFVLVNILKGEDNKTQVTLYVGNNPKL